MAPAPLHAPSTSMGFRTHDHPGQYASVHATVLLQAGQTVTNNQAIQSENLYVLLDHFTFSNLSLVPEQTQKPYSCQNPREVIGRQTVFDRSNLAYGNCELL